MRGFIDDTWVSLVNTESGKSQSAFVRGFIDDLTNLAHGTKSSMSQSAFVRGFIDDRPRTWAVPSGRGMSQSAFVRGFIDDRIRWRIADELSHVSIRVRARLHR